MVPATLPNQANDTIWAELSNCVSLPSPPGVAAKLLELAQCPDTTFEQVATVVQIDPALAAKLLKLSNSSFYSRGNVIDDIKKAISLFGLNGTITVALTFSLVKIPDNSNSAFDFNAFWLRSLASATLCKKLARLISSKEKDSLYLAGLVQDIGMLVLASIRPNTYFPCGNELTHHQALIDAEISEFGVDHSEVGAWLLARWKFPEKFIVATTGSHTLGADTSELSTVVCIASHLADLWSRSNIYQSPEVIAFAYDHLKISDHTMHKLLLETAEEITEVAHLYGVNHIDNSAIHSLLEEAKECLTFRSLIDQQQLMDTTERVNELEQETQQLNRQLNFDSLTGVHSREYALRFLENEMSSGVASQTSMTILFIDLDDFKKINDQYGHHAGDVVLRESAELLKQPLRGSDILARFGGEEFLVILLNTERDAATAICDQLVDNLSNASITVRPGTQTCITASIGMAIHDQKSVYPDTQKLIEVADTACYQAKAQGKNCWVFLGMD